MKVYGDSLFSRLRSIDFTMLLSALALSLISIITLNAMKSDGLSAMTGTRVLVQIFAVVLGLVCMFFISMIDYQAICEKLTIPLFVISVLLLAMTLVIGKEGDLGGGKSWIELPGVPFNIQPSEFVKIFFIITFARHLEYVKDSINNIKSLLGLLAHAGIIIGLVLLQKDLGTALIYIVIMLAMLYTAGLSLWYFLGFAAIAVIAFPIIWPHLGEYRQMRIICGFDPYQDPNKYGYQALMSLDAVGAGGFWGAGINGGSAYMNVPAVQTDFIFSALAEKYGFIGCIVIFALFSTIIVRTIIMARTCKKDYSSYICVGIASVIIAQVIENVGMCLATLPVIGITLPFLSYGGSSVLSTYLMIGVLQSVWAHRGSTYFERKRY